MTDMKKRTQEMNPSILEKGKGPDRPQGLINSSDFPRTVSTIARTAADQACWTLTAGSNASFPGERSWTGTTFLISGSGRCTTDDVQRVDALVGPALDVPDHATLFRQEQRYGDALLSRPSRPPDAVHVGVRVLRGS